MSFKYIASPYTHTSWDVMVARFNAVALLTAELTKQCNVVYSPIVHFHEIAKDHELPTDFEFWQNANRGMLSKASEIIVLMLHGWDKSKGVAAEIRFARKCGIPITYVEPLSPKTEL